MRRTTLICFVVASMCGCSGGNGAEILPIDSAGQVDVSEIDASSSCTPQCEGRECGIDGCNGYCGECLPLLEQCSETGQCIPFSCKSSLDCPSSLVCVELEGVCAPCVGDEDCTDGSFCGADYGCHEPKDCDSDKDCKQFELICDKEVGQCVECTHDNHCGDDSTCVEGYCLEVICVPELSTCDDDTVKVCNATGTGHQSQEDCSESGNVCLDGNCVSCIPFCDDKECGGDNCGGSCGECAGPQDSCIEGSCACLPDCTTKSCGSDGCGGDCGSCQEGQFCVAGQCGDDPCPPDCLGKECGGDGCDGSCGVCQKPQEGCIEGQCVCEPNCIEIECGDDGCGGSCGECGANQYCYVLDAEATCKDQVCPPQASFCDGTKKMLCDDIGASALMVEDCSQGGKSCSNGVCNEFEVVDGRWQLNDDGTVMDLSTGLLWDKGGTIAPELMFPDAEIYCGGLLLGGHDDWRLPSIAELRTLIVGCPETESGGACTTDPDVCGPGSGCPGCAASGGPGESGLYIAAGVWSTPPSSAKFWSGPKCASQLSWFIYAHTAGLYPQWAKTWEHPARAWCVRSGVECVPECTNVQCGSDGCGGSCGKCEGEQVDCINGECTCQPACSGKECGDDGCLGDCGQCGAGVTCANFVCAVSGKCSGACGGASADGSCYCDGQCKQFGDCCPHVCFDCPGTEGCPN